MHPWLCVVEVLRWPLRMLVSVCDGNSSRDARTARCIGVIKECFVIKAVLALPLLLLLFFFFFFRCLSLCASLSLSSPFYI